jgi:thioredoxin-like negative regulator of GroEL
LAIQQSSPLPPALYTLFLAMGRTRTKKVKQAKPTIAHAPSSQPEPTIESLFEKAQELLIQCNYDLAHRFVQRILDRDPTNIEAREMSAVVDLERGEIENARQVWVYFAYR